MTMDSTRQPGMTAANPITEKSHPLHVLTLTPFFPSLEDPTQGSFVYEPLVSVEQLNVVSSVIGVSPVYRPRKHANPSVPASWVRYPQIPGINGLAGAGRFLYARLRSKVADLHGERPINVIHAHAALPCGHAASLLAASLQVPFVVTVHGLDVFNAGSGDCASSIVRRQASIGVYLLA